MTAPATPLDLLSFCFSVCAWRTPFSDALDLCCWICSIQYSTETKEGGEDAKEDGGKKQHAAADESAVADTGKQEIDAMTPTAPPKLSWADMLRKNARSVQPAQKPCTTASGNTWRQRG